MQIKLKWTTKAINDLEKMYEFYSGKSKSAAVRLYNAILDAVDLLTKFPEMAPLEPLLERCKRPYRSLIVNRHFKIIYYIKNNTLYIAAVWDCRQNTSRLKQLFKH